MYTFRSKELEIALRVMANMGLIVTRKGLTRYGVDDITMNSKEIVEYGFETQVQALEDFISKDLATETVTKLRATLNKPERLIIKRRTVLAITTDDMAATKIHQIEDIIDMIIEEILG